MNGERKKLIELLKNAKKYATSTMAHLNIDEVIDISYDDLQADYLLENGVIVPLVKVGGIVWVIYNKCVTPANVMAVYVDKSGGMFDLKILTEGVKSIINKDYTFDMVYITKEEAEKEIQALKEVDENE